MSGISQTRAAVAHLEAFERAALEPASPGLGDRVVREQWHSLQRQVLRAMIQDNQTGATR